MATAFFCILRDKAEAESLREQLHSVGVAEGDVSLCYLEGPAPGETGSTLARVEGYVKPPESRLVATGHFEWGLKGPVRNHSSGSITRVLSAMGIPREEARRYESQVRDGAVLVSAFCGTELLAKRVKMNLQKAHAEEIASLGRSEEAVTEVKEI